MHTSGIRSPVPTASFRFAMQDRTDVFLIWYDLACYAAGWERCKLQVYDMSPALDLYGLSLIHI